MPAAANAAIFSHGNVASQAKARSSKLSTPVQTSTNPPQTTPTVISPAKHRPLQRFPSSFCRWTIGLKAAFMAYSGFWLREVLVLFS